MNTQAAFIAACRAHTAALGHYTALSPDTSPNARRAACEAVRDAWNALEAARLVNNAAMLEQAQSHIPKSRRKCQAVWAMNARLAAHG